MDAAVRQYIRDTPLVQWQREKLHLDVADIIDWAHTRGLRLAPTIAINSSDYEVYTRAGKLLRRGSLSTVRHFIERYQG